MKDGSTMIAEQRQKQIAKGHTPQVDYEDNPNQELIFAAASILEDPLEWRIMKRPCNWDRDEWEEMCRKDTDQRLAIAGAFLAAEIDIRNF